MYFYTDYDSWLRSEEGHGCVDQHELQHAAKQAMS